MRRKWFMALSAIVICFRAAGSDATDDWIKEMVIVSGQFIHGGEPARKMFRNAKMLCGNDTNRFARILYELAQTNDVRMAERMIGCLGRHGTTGQLPFLYSLATNEQHGASAVKSILRLEGVSSNSLSAVDKCLSMTNVQYRADREGVCLFLLDSFSCPQVSNADRSALEQCVLRFAKGCSVYNEHFDDCLSRRMTGYKFSRRRLEVLRKAERSLTIRFNESFITNAINELVAYPEAELPE